MNVNSTASGGGVAELLQTLLAYVRGVGVDARWVVIEGDPAFFEITKRIHNHLYGIAAATADRSAPASTPRTSATLARQRRRAARVHPAGDIVILHDPQTAGLAARCTPRARTWCGAVTSGVDTPNERDRDGWAFLRPYLEPVDAFVFTRARVRARLGRPRTGCT